MNRRDFLKLAGVNLGALLAPGWLTAPRLAAVRMDGQWPILAIEELPKSIREILEACADTFLDASGNLYLRKNGSSELMPQARTAWNITHSTQRDRLLSGYPWGIVLHWFGDTPEKNLDIDGFIRGFDGRRKEEETLTNTSAHFLVGDEAPYGGYKATKIAIVQTQAPDLDGTPFWAAHTSGPDIKTNDTKNQYFVRSYDELARKDPTVHSLLQDIFSGRWVHPNMRTIGIEISGTNFDDDPPSTQKTANTLSLVWALMQRYRIPANRLLGHHEIQLNKGDPGKQFMALMRFLVGVKALTNNDLIMKLLVFGQHLKKDGDTMAAVQRYFNLIRDYHVLTAKPVEVYRWEARSQYWPITRMVIPSLAKLENAKGFLAPIAGEMVKNGYDFLVPGSHEGIDLHHPILRGASYPEQPADIHLIAPGECLYVGQASDCHDGKMMIFRHQQADGAEVLSVYGHLSELMDLTPGNVYPVQTLIGVVDNQNMDCGRFLHFAIAYGATWDLNLQVDPTVPQGAGPTYIRERYLEPMAFLRANSPGRASATESVFE